MRTNRSYTVGEFLKELTHLLSPIAEDLAEREAEEIVEHLTGLDYSAIRFNLSKEISRDIVEKSQRITTERLTGKPLAYVLESTFFFSKDFKLSSETLIPRHDTEHLIAAVLENERGSEPLTLLELGTGSGIIPEILTSENEHWRAVSVDIYEETLKTAIENCSEERVFLVNSDCFKAIKAEKQFDIIVSNPPYIPTHTVKQELDDSVRHFEPHRALDGGEDGLDFYRYLAEVGRDYMKESGRIYLEIGYDQGETVPALFKEFGAKETVVIQDFGNRDRVVIVRY